MILKWFKRKGGPLLNWKKTGGAETTLSEEKEDTNMRRLVKPCYIQLARLWPRMCGPAQHKVQEALTTSLHTLIYYHKLIFPGLNLLCTTEAAEISSLPVANFLDEGQGAACVNYPEMFGSLGMQPGLQVTQDCNLYAHLGHKHSDLGDHFSLG